MKFFSTLLAIIRLLLFVVVMVVIYSALLFTNLLYKNRYKKIERGIVYRRAIIRILHKILGAKITVYGKEFKESGLIISNHRSYFDPIIVLKNILAYPVAKKEVASWPLIGNICKTTGVIFVKRNNKESREETLNEITAVLKKGYSILNTPEGTTHIEPKTIKFLPGAFVLAAELGIPVLPIAIDYKNLNDAWIGNDTFIPHFIRCFGKWHTHIKVSYLLPIYSNDVDTLISESKKVIDSEMLRFRKEWDEE
jgi:1-acyl-sn-glycerol-3-phosphate acyltransferase